MKILNYVWQSAGLTGPIIGYVLVETNVGDIKCYAGVCEDKPDVENPEFHDVERIAKFGGYVPMYVAKCIFSCYFENDGE